MVEGEVLKVLREWLDEKRLCHSFGVQKSAGELARLYGGDVEKAELAGLLHDCAKGLSYEEMLELSEKYGLKLDDICRQEKALIHGPLGARIAEYVFGVKDHEILDAIECHTTGKKDMTLLDKIIYLADFIEPGREYPGVEALRKLALKDLDKAVLQALDNTIVYVVSRGSVLHPRTIEARNQILSSMEGKD